MCNSTSKGIPEKTFENVVMMLENFYTDNIQFYNKWEKKIRGRNKTYKYRNTDPSQRVI